MSNPPISAKQPAGHDRRESKFAYELRFVLDAGRGTEAINLFVKGSALNLFPDDGSLEAWIVDAIGEPATRQLVTLFAVSPCVFCRRGLEACGDCHRHGHFEYAEICESCLGLGVCRCDFCNGSGLSSIETVPEGLRVPVSIDRAAAAFQQIESLLGRLPTESHRTDPVDHMKEQASLILRLTGLLGLLENELGDASDLPWWTIHAPDDVARIVSEWPRLGRRAEERICAAFRGMAETAGHMERDLVAGSNGRLLASARVAYFGQFTTPESLDRTDIDHPVLDRILARLGATAASGDRGTGAS